MIKKTLLEKGAGALSSMIVLLLIVVMVVIIMKTMESKSGVESGTGSESMLAPIEGAQGAKDLIDSHTADVESEF